MINVKRILDDYISGNENKSHWLSYWQELASILLPKRADITQGHERAEDRHSIIYDGAPIRARRGLANATDSIIKPKTSQWFYVRSNDDLINKDHEALMWFGTVEQIMWRAIYSRKARFIQRTGEVDNDLVALGTGCIYTGESKKLNSLNFRSYHPKNVVIFENSDGIVDKIMICQKYSARQAMQEWGEENISERIKESLKQNKNDLHEFIITVQPREGVKSESLLSTNLPFEMSVIEKEAEHLVLESGFHEFPFAVPRWETAEGEVYGRSPGMVALPDAKTLQAMGKTLLVAGQKAVDPPLMVVDDALIGGAKTFPGGMTTIDSEAARSFGGSPVIPLDMGKNLPLGLEMQNAVRNSVEAAFFRNIFNLPIDGPQMTATEIIQRKEEFIREIGPIFGRLEAEYSAPMIERVFGIMLRAGAFPEPPEILQGREVDFEMDSPVQRVKKQIEAASASQAIMSLAPFVEADPSIMDNFDGDEIARSSPDTYGIPQQWLRSKEERDGIREERARASQNMQSMEQAQAMGEVVNNVG